MKRTVSKYVASKLDGLRKKDFRVERFKSSGPGGQHRNKVETAVRITHIATGVSAEATDSKSQARNKRNAFFRLADKLIKHYTKESIGEDETGRNLQRIRTYNEPRNTVKDHRTGIEAEYKTVLDGDLDCLRE